MTFLLSNKNENEQHNYDHDGKGRGFRLIFIEKAYFPKYRGQRVFELMINSTIHFILITSTK